MKQRLPQLFCVCMEVRVCCHGHPEREPITSIRCVTININETQRRDQ